MFHSTEPIEKVLGLIQTLFLFQYQQKPLRDNWADPNADPNEKELLNFFINKEYEVDDDDRFDSNQLPNN